VCQAFAKRADAVAKAVKDAGYTVEIDTRPAEGRKPDRGSFIITARGKALVELKGMPRPFASMKALDIDQVAKDTIAALK
jgi:hypothetical protein